MREIVMSVSADKIAFSAIDPHAPIFAKRKGSLVGMVVKDPGGWVLRTGWEWNAYGHFEDLQQCLETGINKLNYTFHAVKRIIE